MSTDTPNLDWLTVGATVAYVVYRHRQNARVYPAHVDKIGKRDVAVTTSGRTEKFNINHTEQADRGNTWLYRRGSTWDPSTYLAPVDDPAVIEMGEQQRRDRAAGRVDQCAEVFRQSHGGASARLLRDTVDAFLALLDTDGSAGH